MATTLGDGDAVGDFGSGAPPGHFSLGVLLMLVLAWVLPLVWILRLFVRCCFFAYTHRTSVELLETTKRRANIVSRTIPALQRASWEPISDGTWTRFDDEAVDDTAGDEAREAARHRALLFDGSGQAIEATLQAQVEITIGSNAADADREELEGGSAQRRKAPITPPTNTRLDANALYIRQLEEELMQARSALESGAGGKVHSSASCSACSTPVAAGSAASQRGGSQPATARYFIGTPSRAVAFTVGSPQRGTPCRTPGERELAV